MRLLPTSAILASAVLAFSACGGDEDDTTFTACGGALSGSGLWDFSAVALDGETCSMTPATIEGFVNFNSNGRYSVNAKSEAWIFPGAAACSFDTAYGGFYKVEGSTVCFAETEADLAAFPCDESGHDPSARPRSAGAEFCVEGTSLELSSRTFVGLSSHAVLTLTRSP